MLCLLSTRQATLKSASCRAQRTSFPRLRAACESQGGTTAPAFKLSRAPWQRRCADHRRFPTANVYAANQRPAPPAALDSCPAAAAQLQAREMSLTLLSPHLPAGTHSSAGAAPIDGAA